MTQKKFLALGIILISLFSCKKNDSSTVTIREYSEVAQENDAQIQTYLRTHFVELDADKNIIMDTIAGANAGKTSLLNDQRLQKKVLKVKDAHSKYIDHTMYYVILEEGKGKQATVADYSYTLYKGLTLTGTVFEDANNFAQSNWFDLLGNQTTSNAGVVLGFREAVALLKDSPNELTENNDGTLNLPTDYGIGVFILPSGIAYFANTLTNNTPAYSPLIFQIKLLKTNKLDHDSDGIPSIDEITHSEDGIIVYPDCNGNGTPDYLDYRKCSK